MLRVRVEPSLLKTGKLRMTLAAFVLLTWLAYPTAAEQPPNLIFILIDDQGYYDLGCYGATELATPHIDQLAAEGVRFTDYYAAAPICSPSRVGILTGCYPRRVGLATWVQRADSKIGIHPNELTLAELLRDAGYATACIGKWHLGAQPPFLPRAQGFDQYFGLLHNLDPVETVYFEEEGGVPLMRNGEIVKRPADPAELTAAYTDEAISFMRANKKKPFFLYMPHTMAHIPLGVTPDFAGSSNFGLYGDVLQSLDYHVGRLMEELTNLGIADNTVVVYASDNGRGPGRNPSQPIQGGKLSTWEGGIRVPCIAWGPGVGVKAGQSTDTVTRAMDWYPTFATLAGIKVPDGRVLDGRDLQPLLAGQTTHVPTPDEALSLNADLPLRRPWYPAGEWEDLFTRDEYSEAFFYHGSHGELAAVRWREWKLRLNPGLELYNLAQDPGETKLVRNREIARKLRGMAITFQDEMRTDARPAGTYTGSK